MAAWVCRLLTGVQWLLELHASGIVPGLFCLTFKSIFFLFPIPLKDAGQMGPRHKRLFSFKQQLVCNTGVGGGSHLSLSLSFILFLSEKSSEGAKQLSVFIMA